MKYFNKWATSGYYQIEHFLGSSVEGLWERELSQKNFDGRKWFLLHCIIYNEIYFLSFIWRAGWAAAEFMDSFSIGPVRCSKAK